MIPALSQEKYQMVVEGPIQKVKVEIIDEIRSVQNLFRSACHLPHLGCLLILWLASRIHNLKNILYY